MGLGWLKLVPLPITPRQIVREFWPQWDVRERRSILYLGMAMEILNLPLVMYHLVNGQSSYKPQTNHAERMIRPGSSQKHSQTYF